MSKIVVRYISGKHEIFDTLNFTNGEPYKQQGINIVTDMLLRFDNLETEGLIAELYWYDAKTQSDTPRAKESGLPAALRRAGCSIRLVSAMELDELSSIDLDGEMVAWRQGGELINGVKFNAQELLCFSDPTSTSLNARAINVFEYIKNAEPDLSDEKVAERIGYSLDVIKKIRLDELANSINIDEEVADSESSAFESNNESDDYEDDSNDVDVSDKDVEDTFNEDTETDESDFDGSPDFDDYDVEQE